LSDLVERFVFHEDRAKGLVSSLGGSFGIEKEPAGVVPIHDAGSRVLIIVHPWDVKTLAFQAITFSPKPARSVHQKSGSKKDRGVPHSGQELENKGGKPGMHSHRYGNESVDGNPKKSSWAGKTINDPRADLAESP
jgi:hypothetical protein